MYSTANDPYGKQWRSFADELDHSRSGDHLRSEIIRGPAQVCELDLLILLFALRKKKLLYTALLFYFRVMSQQVLANSTVCSKVR